jgi:hypothetical protein
MSAYRTGLNGGLTSRSYTLGRALQCPLNNNLSGLVGLVGCRLRHKLPLWLLFIWFGDHVAPFG